MIASIIGGLIAPGVKGNASDRVVVTWDGLAAFFGFAYALALIAAGVRGSAELSRRSKVPVILRTIVASLGAVVVGLCLFAILRRLPPGATLALGGASGVLVLLCGLHAVRVPYTRAAGLVAAVLGFTGLLRLVTWEVAAWGATHGLSTAQASSRIFGVSRALSTVAVVLEACAQLAAAMVGSSRVDLQACKLEYSIVSPK